MAVPVRRPYDELFDLARERGMLIGLSVSGRRYQVPGGCARDLAAIELHNPDSGLTVVEPVDGDLQQASSRLLDRLRS